MDTNGSTTSSGSNSGEVQAQIGLNAGKCPYCDHCYPERLASLESNPNRRGVKRRILDYTPWLTLKMTYLDQIGMDPEDFKVLTPAQYELMKNTLPASHVIVARELVNRYDQPSSVAAFILGMDYDDSKSKGTLMKILSGRSYSKLANWCRECRRPCWLWQNHRPPTNRHFRCTDTALQPDNVVPKATSEALRAAGAGAATGAATMEAGDESTSYALTEADLRAWDEEDRQKVWGSGGGRVGGSSEPLSRPPSEQTQGTRAHLIEEDSKDPEFIHNLLWGDGDIESEE